MREVQNEELLGHGCFESKHFPRPKRRYFERRFRDNKLSVDRIDSSNIALLKELHAEDARELDGDDRQFYGWHCFKSAFIRRSGVDVLPDPTEKNDWHANVISEERSSETEAELSELLRNEADWIEVGSAPSHDLVTAAPMVIL